MAGGNGQPLGHQGTILPQDYAHGQVWVSERVRKLAWSLVEERAEKKPISSPAAWACLSPALLPSRGWGSGGQSGELPTASRDPGVCPPDPRSGSSRQKGRVLRNPAEKLIHTLATGNSLPPSHSPSGHAKSIRDFSQLVSETWRSWHGFDTPGGTGCVWAAVFGTCMYTANVSPRQEQRTKEWLRVIHPSCMKLQLASFNAPQKNKGG